MMSLVTTPLKNFVFVFAEIVVEGWVTGRPIALS